LTSYTGNRIGEIEGYKDRGNEKRIERKVDREGIEMQNCVEVHPNSDYRIRDGISSIVGGLAGLFLGF